MSSKDAFRYGVSVAAAAVAVQLERLLYPWLQDKGMYMIGCLGVAATALYGGLGPALLAMVLIAIGYQFLILEPAFDHGIADAEDLLAFSLFVSLSLMSSITGALLRRNHERVKALHRRYQNLVDDLDQAFVWTMASDTHEVTFVSQRALAMIGYPPDRLCTDTEIWWDRIHPDDHGAMEALLLRAWADTPEQRIVHRFRHRDGRWLWLRTSVHLVDEPGARYLQGLSVDITPLTDAIREREDVLAVVSHDLKNPLSVILLTTALLRNAGPDEVPLIQQIRRAAERMRDLIKDLLDASVVRSGRFAVQPGTVDVKILVDSAVDGVRPLAEAKGIRLHSRVPGGMPTISGEERRLLQVLTNLLGNAVTYTPAGGTIEVVVEDRGDLAVFSVRDNGPGIPLADQAHLFDRFWRPERSRKAGAGLGLYIAKGIVEAHGGRIWVESQPGAGSTFHVALPKTRTPEQSAAGAA